MAEEYDCCDMFNLKTIEVQTIQKITRTAAHPDAEHLKIFLDFASHKILDAPAPLLLNYGSTRLCMNVPQWH